MWGDFSVGEGGDVWEIWFLGGARKGRGRMWGLGETVGNLRLINTQNPYGPVSWPK